MACLCLFSSSSLSLSLPLYLSIYLYLSTSLLSFLQLNLQSFFYHFWFRTFVTIIHRSHMYPVGNFIVYVLNLRSLNYFPMYRSTIPCFTVRITTVTFVPLSDVRICIVETFKSYTLTIILLSFKIVQSAQIDVSKLRVDGKWSNALSRKMIVARTIHP